MARELGVQEWFSSGVKTLITRSSPLTALECQALVEQNLIQQVLGLRERAQPPRQSFVLDSSIPRCEIRSQRGKVPDTYDISARVSSIL